MHLLCVGGSDAGISAALRARQLEPSVEVTVVVADAYPNFSICGIPYLVSGEVRSWSDLAHRSRSDLEGAGVRLLTDTRVEHLDAAAFRATLRSEAREWSEAYDAVVVGTGALPVRPPVEGLDELGAGDGVHVLHTMGDTFRLLETLAETRTDRAVVLGAGYVGLEMAEALTLRGLRVTVIERLPEVLPTVDTELGAVVRAELERCGVEVCTGATVQRISGRAGALTIEGDGFAPIDAGVVLVSAGVRPDPTLAVGAGAAQGARGAVRVDRHMRTGVPGVFAAGDCAVTHHRLLGETWLPLGSTAHKQGRVAGENALGGSREFAGSLGTQVVKVFDVVAARTGLRDAEATEVGFAPATLGFTADDHKAYYPGATPLQMRWTADADTGRLLGLQLVGRRGAEVAKRIDVAAAALHSGLDIDAVSDLDLSYTPPLGSPWDALQMGAQAWEGVSRTGR